MIEAAVRGIIDFSKVRYFDQRWRNRTKVLLRGMERLNRRELQTTLHQHDLGLLQVHNITKDSFEATQKRLIAKLVALEETYQPWKQHTQATQEKEEAKAAISAWERTFGNQQDPDTKRKIDALAEGLRRRHEEVNGYDPSNPLGLVKRPKERKRVSTTLFQS